MSPKTDHRATATLNEPPGPTPAAAAPARHRSRAHPDTTARPRPRVRHRHRTHRGDGMQVRTINGRQCTDFAGAAELAQRSEISVRTLAAARDSTGFPAAVKEPGAPAHARAKQFFALDDLRAFFAAYDEQIRASKAARVTRVKLTGAADELLDGRQIAKELGIDPDTWRSWVRDALPAWKSGRDAYIPRPDEQAPGTGPGGIARRWKRATIQAFVNERGTTPAGRTRGGGVTLDDLRAVDPGTDRPIADVVADLEQRLGHPVSRQTVARRRRDLRNAAD